MSAKPETLAPGDIVTFSGGICPAGKSHTGTVGSPVKSDSATAFSIAFSDACTERQCPAFSRPDRLPPPR